MFRKEGLTTNQIQGLLEIKDYPDRAVYVVLLPPEDDAVPDEDSDVEEDVLPKDPSHLSKRILSMQVEMVIWDAEDELLDLEIVNDEGETVEEGQDETAENKPGPAHGGHPAKRPWVLPQQEAGEELEIVGPGEPEHLFRYTKF